MYLGLDFTYLFHMSHNLMYRWIVNGLVAFGYEYCTVRWASSCRVRAGCARTSHHVVYCVLRDTHAGDMRIVDVLAHSRARDTQYMCHDTVAWLYH